MADTTNITSEINQSINLSGVVNINTNGVKQQVMTMNCSLSENSVANIQTYVTNQELFLANSQAVAIEVQKFRERATEVAKGINCFVF